MTGLLTDKRIVLTGSSRGLGRAFAIALARHGAAVVVNGTNATAVASVLEEIEQAGGTASAVVGSVTDDSVTEHLVQTCVDHYGGIDVMITNAGIARDRTLLNATPEEFDETIAVNLRGTWSACRHAARAMRRTGGLIMLISSAAAATGTFGQAAYAASKGGCMGLLYALDHELERYGIRVNALAPTASTEMTRERFDVLARRSASAGGVPPSPAELGFGTPDAVAPVLVYLCSDGAAHVRGQFLRFNGHRLVVWRHPAEATIIERSSWTPGEIGDVLARGLEPIWRLVPAAPIPAAPTGESP